jgi:hypothetical protein
MATTWLKGVLTSGVPRDVGALTATLVSSAYPRCPLAWSRLFDDPIPLPDGGKLITLRDAGEYISDLREAEQEKPHWQAATEALLLIVKSGPPMLACIAVMQALNHGKPAEAPRRQPRGRRP